jgi:hypothetical protein
MVPQASALTNIACGTAGGGGRAQCVRTHAQSSSKKTKKPKLPLHGNDLNGEHGHVHVVAASACSYT